MHFNYALQIREVYYPALYLIQRSVTYIIISIEAVAQTLLQYVEHICTVAGHNSNVRFEGKDI